MRSHHRPLRVDLAILPTRRFPWGGKLGHIDHVTIPTSDLRVAEEFYVGLPGARIVLRVDKPMLLRMGWSGPEIDRNKSGH